MLNRALPWVAALSTLPLACSTQQASGPDAVFASVDTNNDGQIGIDEFSHAYFNLAFSNLDIDADGNVTLQEWKTIETEDTGAVVFLQLDQDGNGRLVYAEYSSPEDRRETIANMFGTLDRNADGVLLEEEIVLGEG